MYAVIETGGKQYRVQPGDVIDVERLPGVAEDSGDEQQIVFDRVLLVDDGGDLKIGRPVVEGAQVSGVFLKPVRGPKILIFKMKRRKGYRRKNGHRQDLHRVAIKNIEA